MRNPERIIIFCNQLASAWAANCPDMRFGQLISNLYAEYGIEDAFYIEDGEMLDKINEYLWRKVRGAGNGRDLHQQG